ncbi:MAG TPA: ATP-dependent zinc metalloprotease FtsH [Gemmatimonadales bacterium]|nr:ATP-dependent zinc metalloprotease FtsH [Gemmatimonadales bacterium]
MNGTRNQRRRRPSPVAVFRPAVLWVLAFATAAMLFRVIQGREKRLEITYSDVTRELARDNIAAVEIVADERRLAGEFKSSVRIAGRDVREFRANLPFDDPAPLVARLEQRGVRIRAAKAGTSWLAILLAAIPWLLIGGFWLMLMRQMRVGGQRALSFGRMGVRPVASEQPKVTFADVAGAEEAKAELQEVIDFLKDPAKFQRIGGRLPKGVLLVGPPGTGKTLLARAVAGEAGVPFFSISGSDFVELFVGVGAARVRSLFEQGKAQAPCIIFIDELDAVGRQRGVGVSGVHEEREQTLNQLLVELDGFQPTEGVVVLSATNRPDVLDPALLRPGRFDRQIVVELPDVRAREQILAVHARKIQLAGDVELATIARGTPGLSGADLANLVNEAALFAARRNKDRADRRDFEDAKDKIMLGVERRSVVLSPEDRRLAAYHEAGHALVSLLIPGLDPVHKVTIVPRGRALGITFALPEEDRRSYTRAYILGRLAVAYGGRVAEEVVFGPDRITTGAANDFQQATELARRMVTQFGMSEIVGPIAVIEHPELALVGRDVVPRYEVSQHTAELVDREVRRIVEEAYKRAMGLIRANRATLDALASALLERETLERAEVEAIVAGTPPPRAATAEQPGAGPAPHPAQAA